MLGSLPIRYCSRPFSAFAKAFEKVVNNTRASGWRRAKATARWNATIVLPVPADPRDSRWPGIVALDKLALRRVQKDRPFLPWEIERAFNSSTLASTRKRRCASG